MFLKCFKLIFIDISKFFFIDISKFFIYFEIIYSLNLILMNSCNQ